MNITTEYENRRILLIDDNPSIHEDFRQILCAKTESDALAAEEAELFGDGPAKTPTMAFDVSSAMQGQDGLALVQKSVEKGVPFAVAFVDVRMPPGWDGVETVVRIWQVDPRLQVVLCTAFSDHSWQQIVQRLGRSDRFLILKKPFDVVEAQQMALTLTTKWNLARDIEGQRAALEAAVEVRTRQLAKARKAAEAASHAKSQSLASISHEIRTPMNAILQFAETLLMQGDIAKAPPARIKAIKTLLNNGQNLLGMVNNVQDFAMLETGKMDLERADFDPREVTQGAAEAFREAATEKGLELTCQIDDTVPHHVLGDAKRLTQILSNLVENAIKFTEHGSVTVEVRLDKQQDAVHLIRFNVTDTGVGVDMDQMGTLFQAFTQTHASATPRFGSAGLGLAICKGLAELHGGEIGLSSMPGEGSTFWFTLALGRSDVPVPVQEATA